VKVYSTDDPDDQHAQALLVNLSRFNRAHVPNLPKADDSVAFNIIATSDDDRLVGGIRAVCFWNTVHIDLFWVDDTERSKGIGLSLLSACEDRALAEGCNNAYVETFSWQAQPFYERNGYQLLGTIDGRPEGHSTHYLSKKLNHGNS
jgi:GNAT superfamily N-acetyltransferase